jgi:hypothetical protein
LSAEKTLFKRVDYDVLGLIKYKVKTLTYVLDQLDEALRCPGDTRLWERAMTERTAQPDRERDLRSLVRARPGQGRFTADNQWAFLQYPDRVA